MTPFEIKYSHRSKSETTEISSFLLSFFFRSGTLLTDFRLDHCGLDLRDGGSGTERDDLDRLPPSLVTSIIVHECLKTKGLILFCGY